VPNQYYDNDLEAQRFQPGTTVSADAVDSKLDEIASGFEAVEVDTNRSLKFPAEPGTSQELTATALERRRKVLGFDENGDLIVTAGFNYRGSWAATTTYFTNDVLRDPATKNLYVVVNKFTSGAAIDLENLALAINVEDVEAAKTQAQTAATTATTKAGEASASALSASDDADATAADRVATGQDRTATAADRVVTGQDRSAASISEASALVSKNKAQKWAEEATDTPVESGKFSAKHWAEQAENVVLGGTFNDSSTNSTQGWTSQKIQNTINSATTTATSKTLTDGERCFVTAATQTITLPASPTASMSVSIGVQAFEDTVIARNGSNIMGLAENMVIDKENTVVTLLYVNATEGWRIL